MAASRLRLSVAKHFQILRSFKEKEAGGTNLSIVEETQRSKLKPRYGAYFGFFLGCAFIFLNEIFNYSFSE